MTRRLLLPLLLSCALALPAQEPARVWVNTGSGVYHCPGTAAYAKTARGAYLTETEARRRGFRANGGRICSAPGTLDEAPNSTLPDVQPDAPSDSTVPCILTHVEDGDTLECASVGRVRLIGIDTPESGPEQFGNAATAALAALVPLGATIQLQTDLEHRDRHRRLLAYVWYEGRMINWLLVRHGWAVSYRYPPNTLHSAAFEVAETRARSERRGLWRLDAFSCRPEQYRKRSCPSSPGRGNQ